MTIFKNYNLSLAFILEPMLPKNTIFKYLFSFILLLALLIQKWKITFCASKTNKRTNKKPCNGDSLYVIWTTSLLPEKRYEMKTCLLNDLCFLKLVFLNFHGLNSNLHSVTCFLTELANFLISLFSEVF